MSLFRTEKDRVLLEDRIKSTLQDIKALEIGKIDVHSNGLITINIDIKEKSNAMGELGFWSSVWVIAEEKDSIEIILNEVVKSVEVQLQKSFAKWRKVKAIFKEKFPTKPPTRRSKAIELCGIYKSIRGEF